MMRKLLWVFVFSFMTIYLFAQTSALRDYVGLINQTFHPEVIAYMNKLKDNLQKRGNTDAVKAIDNYLKGVSGSGFVFVAKDGKNYIITNQHVISQSYHLSVTFEKQDGVKTSYEGLSIVAADEDMDIALLSFAEGTKPFTQGLGFLARNPEEGEEVFSAGFPVLGNTNIWQFGQGIISNASVKFPESDDSDKMMGPYIQHTAQVDPGNSGGPLLVRSQGSTANFSVVGINTLGGRYRQAANYAIPLDRVNAFLEAAFNTDKTVLKKKLDDRVAAFIDGLGASKAVYPHIAKFLSNACTAENAEFAIDEVIEKAPATVQNRIFYNYPVDTMNQAVGWLIENRLRPKSGAIKAKLESITENGSGGYTVSISAGDSTIASEWVNEYGIWQIEKFGDFAAGDKTLIEKKAQEKKESGRLRVSGFQMSAGYVHAFDFGPAFGFDLKGRGEYSGGGLRVFTGGGNYIQIEGFAGAYIPIRIGKAALTPFAEIGIGLQIREKTPTYDRWGEEEETLFEKDVDLGISLMPGLQFTTSAVPGLYLQAAFELRASLSKLLDDAVKDYPYMLFIGVGYTF